MTVAEKDAQGIGVNRVTVKAGSSDRDQQLFAECLHLWPLIGGNSVLEREWADPEDVADHADRRQVFEALDVDPEHGPAFPGRNQVLIPLNDDLLDGRLVAAHQPEDGGSAMMLRGRRDRGSQVAVAGTTAAFAA